LQLCGPLLVIGITCTAPESPRWLCRNGHHGKALQVMAKYHANGKSDDPLVQWQFDEVKSTIEREETMDKASYVSCLLKFDNPGRN
jgi:hypothetical protein